MNVYDSSQYPEGLLNYGVLKKDYAMLHLQFMYPTGIIKSEIKIEISQLKIFYLSCKNKGILDREFSLDATPWNTLEFFILDPTG
jgi:hypothetical protein